MMNTGNGEPDFYGALPTGSMGKKVPHKGQLDAPQAPLYLVNTAYYGGESPNMTSPKESPKTAMCIQTQQQATTL